MEINQKNAIGEGHGYWDDNNFKCHYYNGKNVGFETYSYSFKCHYVNDDLIGCKLFYNSQYYFNNLGKKFGEKIKWK